MRDSRNLLFPVPVAPQMYRCLSRLPAGNRSAVFAPAIFPMVKPLPRGDAIPALVQEMRKEANSKNVPHVVPWAGCSSSVVGSKCPACLKRNHPIPARGASLHITMISPNESEPTPTPADAVELFQLGQVVATPGVLGDIPNEDIQKALRRHISGDWGEVNEEDWKANDNSLEEGFRLLSVYHSSNGFKFYVITEWDRSVTTVLLPEEY